LAIAPLPPGVIALSCKSPSCPNVTAPKRRWSIFLGRGDIIPISLRKIDTRSPPLRNINPTNTQIILNIQNDISNPSAALLPVLPFNQSIQTTDRPHNQLNAQSPSHPPQPNASQHDRSTREHQWAIAFPCAQIFA
jgi:hypothetical protein